MKRTLLEKLGDFVLGKGFYIVLFLCVATIGISGYYLIRSATAGPDSLLEPAAANPAVTLPDGSGASRTPSAPPAQDKAPVKTPSAAPKVPSVPEPDETAAPSAQNRTPQVSQSGGQSQAQAPASAAGARPVYTWPVKGQVLRAFSVETLSYDETMGDWRTHAGVDIAAGEGFQVLCTSDGVVDAVYQDDMMGSTVVVAHPNGLMSVYSNLSSDISVAEGQEVETGTVLGTLGSSAIAESASAPHLHLEMLRDGQPVDPLDFLPEK